MDFRTTGRITALAAATMLLVAACGGSGGSGGTTAADPATPAPPSTPGTPATTAVAVTVVDGALRNALVCLDMNRNGACDSGEPSARTDAAGNATLQVNAADAGKYPVVAVVGTDAVDADNGPVTTPFVLKAPADQPALVSPITTLVQTHVEATGATTAAAAAAVQAQIGLNVSLFQDFTKSTTPEGQTLNAIARTVVVTTQQQNQAVASSVGQPAIDGSTITQQSLDQLIARKILEILPSVVSQLSSPAVQAAIAAKDPVALNAALAPVVTSAVTSAGISSASVATLVGIANQSVTGPGDTAAATPAATATLNQLTFNSAGSWFQRLFTGSAAQNTPDANGLTRAVERRSRKATNGSLSAVAHWGFGGNPMNQSDLHWNGATWVHCGLQTETISGPRDAQGRATYDYCDKFDAGVSTRAVFDVSGKTMIDVYNQARGAGFTNLTIANASTVLGSAVFPANAKLFYQTNSPLTTAVAYSPIVNSEVRVFSAPIAAGKTSPSDTTSACASITSANAEANTVAATTLEGLVAASPGLPCVYSPASITVSTTAGTTTVSSGPRNDWWSNSSVSLGTIGTAAVGAIQPATSPSFYTTNTLLRVAFGAGNEAKYYSCQQRANDGSPRNCDPIGTGTYSISTLGDARIMTFANTPVQAANLQERVFVERGGKVYFGYRNRATPNSSARLNLPAALALLSTLGMEAPDPNVPFALTAASYQGDWKLWKAADTAVTNPTVLQIFPTYSGGTDTSYRCLNAAGQQYACALTLNPPTGAVTLGDATGTLAGTLDMSTGEVSGVFAPTNGPAETVVGRRR